MEAKSSRPEAAPLDPAEAPVSGEAPVPAEGAAAEAPAPEAAQAPQEADSAPEPTPETAEAAPETAEPAPDPEPAQEAAESAPDPEPAQEAAESAAGQAAPDPDSDPRYKNKYAKQHRSDLDRLPDGVEKNYLMDRVFPQMAYYSKASAVCKITYHRLTVLCIIFNGIIPFIMLFEEFTYVAPYVKFAVTALSSAAGILTAIVALKRHRELWIQYRTCLEQLKRAVSMYFLGVGDFDCSQKPEERARTLFAVCENILSVEHNQWTELNKEKKDD